MEAAQQQFEQLFQRSRRGAYRLAYRLTRNACDAEDITQDAYLRAWLHFDHFDGDRSFEAWLFKIVTHRALDLLRRQKRMRLTSLDLPGSYELADPDADPREKIGVLLQEERLEAAVEALPAHYREVVRLCFMEACPYLEIAERMGCAVGTVRSRIHRARAMLRLSMATGAE
jgi:RNA polymerase sigma-70 factor (ECF subfamily)